MVKDDKDDEKTNPGREVNGGPLHPEDAEDKERTYFQAHVRKAARASIPETPEEMLPWLVGRMAANEIHQKNFEAYIEGKLEGLANSINRAAASAQSAAASAEEIARRAPTVREKYTFATGLVVVALGLVAKFLGIDVGPLLGP